MRTHAFAVLLALLPATAWAQDVEAGHVLARMWCAACHQVEGTVTGPSSDAMPSFRSVAAMSSTTRMSLTVFLSTPHPAMPNYSLTRREIADVSAYILSLRPKPRQRN
jgi:mono/diheme cytochrome c family protein